MAADRPPTIGELASAVVSADPELQSELSTLLKLTIKHMQYTMIHGDNASRNALAKSITPQLLKGLQSAQASEGEAEMRSAYERIMEELAGGSRETEPDD